MKVKIEFDTDLSPAHAKVSVDGKHIGYLQELELRLGMDSGEFKTSRLTVGYGGRVGNKVNQHYKSDGGSFKLV